MSYQKASIKDERSVYSNYLKEHLPFVNEDRTLFPGVVIAGGAVRAYFHAEQIEDFDLFFRRNNDFTFRENIDRVRHTLMDKGFKETFVCPEGKLYTYKKDIEIDITKVTHYTKTPIKVQLITEKEFIGVQELLDSFDFTVTQFAYDDEGRVWWSPQAISDTVDQMLNINKITYPVATLNRIIKYNKKGYNTREAARQFVDMLVDEAIAAVDKTDSFDFRSLGDKIRDNSIFSADSMRIYID